MSSTYSTNLKLQLMATGENSTTWGNVTNLNLGTALEESISGSSTITLAGTSQTISFSNTNSSQPARNMRLNLTGTAGTSCVVTVQNLTSKVYLVNNAVTDSNTVTLSMGSGSNVAIPAGTSMWVYSDGTNVTSATSYLPALSLGAPLPITSGGTGSNTAANARTALGLGTMAVQNANEVTITAGSLSGITSLTATNVSSSNVAITGGNVSGVTITASNISALSAPLPVGSGGTGVNAATASNGQLLIGNGTGFTLSTLTAGSNITITNSSGGISISASAGSTGTVTSVGGTGTVNGISLTGTVTSSGNLTLGGTLSGVSLTSQVTGTLPIANGGTNATTAAAALTSLGAAAANTVLGVGQSWSNPTRSAGTTYTNSGTRPIQVMVSTAASGSGTYSLSATCGGVSVANCPVGADYAGHGGIVTSFIVPASATYSVSISGSGYITNWAELS